ncbi:MAG: hypothetical protein LAO24_12555 [Acidobacteriia bacterium]|nr:hypothetical protein [Terriglobia bacterium]
MSEERRRRQQERENKEQPKPIPRKYFIGCGVVILLATAYYAGWHHRNHRYDPFAQCLASKHARMYGLYWCPHCIDQKEMFGKAFQYVPYQECAIRGSRELVPECKEAGTKNFPAWKFEGEPLHEGVLPLEDLSQRTGCSLP